MLHGVFNKISVTRLLRKSLCLWTGKLHYGLCRSPPLGSTHVFLTSTLILLATLHIDLPGDISPEDFQPTFFIHFSFLPFD